MSMAAALVLAMTFSAERSVQVAAGGRVEVLAGAVPDDPLRPSRAQMAVAVIPVLGLHVQRQRYELTGLYRPRVFMRIPNRLDLKRPLLLHQGSIEHRLSWSRRTIWQNRLHLSIGEVDYALSAFVFDPAQPTVPTDDVTPLVRGQASSTLTHAVSRRVATGATLFGAYNAPLYEEDATGFRTSARVEVEPFVGYQLDRRNELTFLTTAGFSWFSLGIGETGVIGTPDADSGATTFAMVAPTLRLRHQLSRTTQGAISGGFGYLQVVQGSEMLGARQGEVEVAPTAGAELQNETWRSHGKSLVTGAFAQYRWFFDPILGRPVRRLGVGAMAALDLPPDWTVRPTVTYFTSIGNDEFEPPEFMSVRRFDQSMLRIDLPVTYEVSRYFGLEFGVRSNLRGPAIGSGGGFTRVELWAYGALRFVFDPKDVEAGWSR